MNRPVPFRFHRNNDYSPSRLDRANYGRANWGRTHCYRINCQASSPTHLSLPVRSAFTLVELLVVIAIIGILIAILVPAVQMVRESARRSQCGSQMRQQSYAVLQYEFSNRRFPPGFVWPDRTLWQAFTLPYLEQKVLYETLEFGAPYTSGPNAAACGTFLPVFQCPSADRVEPIDFEGIPKRMPCTYLACGSGTAQAETGTGELLGAVGQNGVFYQNSQTRHAELSDGASQTIMIGEALFLADVTGIDNEGDNQAIDHWYIGSTDDLTAKNASEALGSTAVPINAFSLDLDIERKEISFSSRHPSGAQFIFMDGHLEFLSESIDAQIFSAMGTRNGGEIIGDEY